MKRNFIFLTAMPVIFCFVLAVGAYGEWNSKVTLVKGKDYETFMKMAHSPLKRMPDLKAWKKVVPQVTAITIKSSFDQTDQPALFYNSGSDR